MELVDENGLTLAEALSNNDADWDEDHWEINFINCVAEDANGNREDANGNGILDPQDPSLLAPLGDGSEYATLVGDSLTTDALGTGLLELLYPASSAFWARIEIVARAHALGSESTASFISSLPMISGDLDNANATPANVRSPYGTELDCSTDN